MDGRIEELLAFYALGTLTEEERRLVEAYLEEHPEVRAEIEELEFAASALPYSTSPVEPSERPKKALMARIAADQRTRASTSSKASPSLPARPRNRFAGFQSFAFSALSLIVAVVAVALMFALNREVSRLRDEVAALRSALVLQANTIEQLNRDLGEVNAKLPQTTPSTLTAFDISGTEARPEARGQLMTDPSSSSAVLVVSGLAPLEAGKIYQIWLIEGGTPMSAGFLSVDARGQGVAFLTPEEAISSYNALGISIEPEEGSLQPTGDIVMLGEFN